MNKPHVGLQKVSDKIQWCTDMTFDPKIQTTFGGNSRPGEIDPYMIKLKFDKYPFYVSNLYAPYI